MIRQIITHLTIEELSSMIEISVENAIRNAMANMNINKINELQKPQEELMTLDEVCNWLKKSKVTIHKWKKTGILNSYSMGNKIYFKRSEVLASLKNWQIDKLHLDKETK